MKKRILVFQPIIAPYRIDFFNRLTHEGETKVCLTWKNLHDQTFDYSKIEEQFEFKPIYLEGGFIQSLATIVKLLKTFKPDIVFVSECGFIALLVVLFKLLLRKDYLTISMIDDSYDMLVGNNQFSKKHALAEKLLIPLFDNIINVEPRVSLHFQKLYGKGLFFPIIVDEQRARQRYERIIPLSEEYVRKYNLEGKRILLFVGRLVELKNLQAAIPAFMKQNDPNSRFIIVGSGDYEQELRRQADGDERILFVGRYEGDELYAWYNLAHWFILPSYQEAFGAVTNEALLAGCHVMVSKKAGSNCLVSENENGVTFIPLQNDIEQCISLALKQAIPLALPLHLRENLMPYCFEPMMTSLIKQIV